jgi:hypothetical protein
MQRKVDAEPAGHLFHRALGLGASAFAGSAAQTSRSNIVRARTGHDHAK